MENKPKITVYGTSWCSFCHSLMHWLDQQGVVYEEIDVEADPTAMKKLLESTDGEFVVPVTIIGGQAITGFDRPAIKKALKEYGAKNG